MPTAKRVKKTDPLEVIMKAVSMNMTQNVTIQAEGNISGMSDGSMTIEEKKEKLKVRIDPQYTSIVMTERDAESGKKETKTLKASDLKTGKRAIVNCSYDKDRSEWSAMGVTLKKIKE